MIPFAGGAVPPVHSYGNIIFIQLEKIMLRGKKGLTTISVNDIVTVQSVQQIITVTNENKIWAQ